MAVIIRLWYSLINCHAVIIFKVWDVSVFCFQFLSIFLKGHQSETLKISDCKLEWIRILQVCMFLSFFFFCCLFWKLLIFVSVNPTFLQLGVQFCWLCFLCLPCTYSVERRFVFRAFVFCAPILIVVSMGQVFCCFSQILFWKQSQVPGSSCCKSVFVFITTSHFPPFHELLLCF